MKIENVPGRCLVFALVLFVHGPHILRATPVTPVLDAGDRTIVSVGQSVTLSGLMEVSDDPPPIGYPGPIMRDFTPPLFEKIEEDRLVPIRAMLLLIPPVARPGRPEGGPSREEDRTVSVLVSGRYFRFLGAPAMIVTSIEIDGVPMDLRGRRFQVLHGLSEDEAQPLDAVPAM